MTVAISGAVAKIQLGIETVAAGWQCNRDCKIARSGVQIGREFFADAMQCSAAVGKRNHLGRSAGLVSHGTFVSIKGEGLNNIRGSKKDNNRYRLVL